MNPDEYTEDKPKKHFEWGYLYKVYLVILIAVFLLALANQANAGVFLEINGNMDYYDSQLPLGDIIQNSDTWDAVSNYMNDVHGVPFPTYSEATQMDDLLENVLMYYVGQYCNLSGTTAQQVFDTCMDFTDTASQVWDLLTLDLESGDFIATPNHSGDLSDVIHGVVDPLIYDTSNPSSIGGWRLLTSSASQWAQNSSGNRAYYGCQNGDIYMTVINPSTGSSGRLFSTDTTSADLYSSQWGSTNLSLRLHFTNSVVQTYTVDGVTYYYWFDSDSTTSYSTGYYYNYDSSYSACMTALAELWGTSHGEPYLNGNGYIINENPTYAPLSGFSALNYPYRTKIVDNHTDTTDPDDPVEYPEGVNEVEPAPVYKDVPTWLVDPSVDIPEEPDYLENVDVELPEIEPDTGFITDCYNALPSGIVSMIAVGLGLGVVMKIIS